MGNAAMLVCSLFALIPVAAAAPANLGWQLYSDPAGTRVDVPVDLFSQLQGPSEQGRGNQYTTADGQSRLSVYVLPSMGLSPSAYLRKHMPDTPSDLDYYRATASFFAVSKYSGDKVLYRRCNFERAADLMHCIDLSYPAALEREWDGIVTRISRSLRPLAG